MNKESLSFHLWLNTIFLSAVIVISFIFLNYWIGETQLASIISKSLAGTSAILIGLSFMMSSLGFYLDMFDDKVIYRKYMGLIGYYFALAYSVSLVMLYPDKYFYGLIENLGTADVILGLIAMALLTFMAIISNSWAMKRLGPKVWRKLFRVGFFAWVLLAIRAYLIESDLWIEWIKSLEGFPPPRLLLSLYVIAVILLRVSIEFVKKYNNFKKNNESF